MTLTTLDPDCHPAEIEYEFVFMQWDYTLTVRARARGHVKGFDGLSSALCEILETYEQTPMILTHPDGDTLECGVLDDEDELLKMLVSARIVSVKPWSFKRKEAQP